MLHQLKFGAHIKSFSYKEHLKIRVDICQIIIQDTASIIHLCIKINIHQCLPVSKNNRLFFLAGETVYLNFTEQRYLATEYSYVCMSVCSYFAVMISS